MVVHTDLLSGGDEENFLHGDVVLLVMSPQLLLRALSHLVDPGAEFLHLVL